MSSPFLTAVPFLIILTMRRSLDADADIGALTVRVRRGLTSPRSVT